MSAKLLVGNIPLELEVETLQDLFSKYGGVRSIHIPVTDIGRSRGFDIVEMTSRGEALSAHANLASISLDGRPLTISLNVETNQKKQKTLWETCKGLFKSSK